MMVIQIVARFFTWLLAFIAGLSAAFAAMTPLRWVPVAAALCLLPMVQTANAQGIPNNVWLVDGDNGNDANDGQGSWADARETIQSVLTDINLASGDQIWVVASTTSYIPGTAAADTFELVDGVWLLGGFAGTETDRKDANPYENETTLSGNLSGGGNAYHVVTAKELEAPGIPANFTRLDGFIIEGGDASGDQSGHPGQRGGGLIVFDDDEEETGAFHLKVSRCLFRDNDGGNRGGAVAVLRREDTLVIHNVELTNCEFRDNTATNGGAVWTFGGQLTLNNCLFVENSATNNGGAISLAQMCPGPPTQWLSLSVGSVASAVTVNSCTFFGNDAGVGAHPAGLLHCNSINVRQNM